MQNFTRGKLIDFSFTPYDHTGEIVTDVPSATVYISHPTTCEFPDRITQLGTTTLTLVQDTTTFAWGGTWDSSASGPGQVWYNSRTTQGELTSDDGSFRLFANPANLIST